MLLVPPVHVCVWQSFEHLCDPSFLSCFNLNKWINLWNFTTHKNGKLLTKAGSSVILHYILSELSQKNRLWQRDSLCDVYSFPAARNFLYLHSSLILWVSSFLCWWTVDECVSVTSWNVFSFSVTSVIHIYRARNIPLWHQTFRCKSSTRG